ncbi:MAG: hypothetical protein IKO49_08030 [Bacilli bacterium]|nr:hypothetical protein [Bacilli bacterium]
MNYKRVMNKMLIKTGIFIILILAFAIICTYKIYNKFEGDRDKILNSSSLKVTYHGLGEKVSLKKITPVTDSVGLSSNPYKFTIKNNTNTKVKYKVVLEDDIEQYEKDDCGEYKIPNDIIKLGIHTKGNVSEIYNLDDLDDNVLDVGYISARDEVKYTIRLWISQNTLFQDADMHYHGIIKVIEVN